MQDLIRRTLDVLRAKQVLRRLGVVVSLTVIAIACYILFHLLRTIDVDKVIDAQRAVFDTCVAANGAANCSFSLEPSALITRELLIGFAGLGLVALLPVAFTPLLAGLSPRLRPRPLASCGRRHSRRDGIEFFR